MTRQRWLPWLLLAPMLTVFAVLLFWPIIRVVNLSLQDYGLKQLLKGETNYVGLANYKAILGDSFIWTTVLPNTVVFALVCVVLTMILGTIVALLLNNLSPLWRTVCAMAIMVAWAIPSVTGTYVFVWLFEPLNGLVSTFLSQVGLIDAGSINWFTGRITFFMIAAANVVYHGFPFIAITVLAGLMSVPKELYEAAEIDGATAWQRFWRITVPMLKPVFAVCAILSTIWDFKVFNQIYLMPGGDGANKDVYNLGVWSYVESFGQGRYGFGAAIAVLLTLILLVITVIYMRTLFKEDDSLQ
ncbi:N,N'-diacetylchitobiose transport system permease protein [Bowdeniella nasicola]|uniref:N,N'-diacetylchitobiose transport system permease protein n=1 Tax=Bowdeniella nasicola TaxID=208480 RepID=A0A1H4AB03_9ACTO|nr:sugar ABC transporter permease [Bowdeniella nasicola]SEA32968.1 N,N'-diacetylchitobiose transport system permease protein [Bowdeniella nasicola]